MDNTCKWLMFTGGDNVYEENWIDRVSNIISTHPDAKVIAWEFQDESEESNVVDHDRDISNYLIKTSSFYMSSATYNGTYSSNIRR